MPGTCDEQIQPENSHGPFIRTSGNGYIPECASRHTALSEREPFSLLHHGRRHPHGRQFYILSGPASFRISFRQTGKGISFALRVPVRRRRIFFVILRFKLRARPRACHSERLRHCFIPSGRIQDRPFFYRREAGNRDGHILSRRKSGICLRPDNRNLHNQVHGIFFTARYNHSIGRFCGDYNLLSAGNIDYRNQTGQGGGRRGCTWAAKGRLHVFINSDCSRHYEVMDADGPYELHPLLLHKPSQRRSALCRQARVCSASRWSHRHPRWSASR